MSPLSHAAESVLATRSQFAKAGARKATKTTLSRAARQKANALLDKEVLALQQSMNEARALQRLMSDVASHDLHSLSNAELEAWADAMVADDAEAAMDREYEEADAASDLLDQSLCDEAQVPLHLQGSLPDWMLAQLEDANGDAFAALSLFEAKNPSPKVAISMVDEVMYA